MATRQDRQDAEQVVAGGMPGTQDAGVSDVTGRVGGLSVDLSGHIALVTGGGSGIGRAIALVLDACGARVAIAGRRQEPLDETARSFAQSGAAIQADLTAPDTPEHVIASVSDQIGAPTLLINNAGAAESAPFARSDDGLLRRMLAVNLEAAFALTRAALPHLRAAPAGRIVNIASTAGLKGYPYVTAYVAAKHGLIGFTRALAIELAETSVTVNAVCPGFTDTPLLDRSVKTITAKTGTSAEDARDGLAAHNPQGRLVVPDEVAAAVLYLCAPAAQAMTGQAMAVAGGEVM
ncbi:MAG: SDR family NAD(P)-dependent oxidoreductase [Pseudomonadota bacterium]